MTQRAGAQRNHDRLLDVAEECFGERGLDCSIDEIARRAGVGHGTVFRRFATKDELVTAVLGRRLGQLTASVGEAAAEDDPWLVRRAQRAGVLRRVVSSEDVMKLIPAAAGYPDVVLDGLRAR